MRISTFLLTSIILSSCGQMHVQSSSLILMQGNSEYESRTEPEIEIQGTLSFTANPTQSPSERVSRYMFNTPRKTYYFYDIPDKEEALKPFLGKNIYIKGKIIDIHINDVNWPNEVWPAVISIDN